MQISDGVSNLKLIYLNRNLNWKLCKKFKITILLMGIQTNYSTNFNSASKWIRIFKNIFLKKWAIPCLFFLYFRLFNTVDSVQMFDNSLPMSGFDHGSLVLETTALPTEPQPLPLKKIIFTSILDWTKTIFYLTEQISVKKLWLSVSCKQQKK